MKTQYISREDSLKCQASSANKVGWMLCALMGGLLIWILSGCTTPRNAPQARGGYYENYAQPTAVSIRSDNDFYEPLSPYGRWQVVGGYGQCWIPAGVGSGWQPYSNGYWQNTDAGWYWVSDEPWGWATYHYGRWDFSPSFGWYWVPQTQWAPSWVSWRQGNGYVGWAPLAPAARNGRGGYVEVNHSVVAPRYVFVEERRFLEPVRPSTVIVNNTVINKTTNITKTHIVNKAVINEGPSATIIEQTSGRKIQAVPARDLRRQQEAAVANKNRSHPAVQEKPVPVPTHTTVAPRDPNHAPSHEARQAAQQPTPTTTIQPDPPPPPTRPVAELPPPPENRRRSPSEPALPVTETKHPNRPDQQQKHDAKMEKKAEQDSKRHNQKPPSEAEQDGTNTVNKVHENKDDQ